jgi:hypothetical protein
LVKLEDIKPNCSVRGLSPTALITVVSVQWFGSDAIELTYKANGSYDPITVRNAAGRAPLPYPALQPEPRLLGGVLEVERSSRL